MQPRPSGLVRQPQEGEALRLRPPVRSGRVIVKADPVTAGSVRLGRVAGWRADQVTVKEPDHGSTPPPINRIAGFPRSGWKSTHSVAAFPILPSLYLGERSVCCSLQRRFGSWR